MPPPIIAPTAIAIPSFNPNSLAKSEVLFDVLDNFFLQAKLEIIYLNVSVTSEKIFSFFSSSLYLVKKFSCESFL